MARIRTIKPEFFTSEDIVSLSPMARLLYISTWCEADKEGRLIWKPRTFKLRYFPGDSCDIEALCDELVASGLVVLYGDGLAYIPSFKKHQHLNPRESSSILPNPDASSRVTDASARVNPRFDAQGGREGKGREGNDSPPTPSDPSAIGAVGKALKGAGIDPQTINLSDPILRSLVEQGATPEEFAGLAREAISGGKRNPIAWVLAVLPQRRSDAANVRLAAAPVVKSESSEDYVKRMAEEREAERKRLEGSTGPPPDLRDKVKAMVKEMRV